MQTDWTKFAAEAAKRVGCEAVSIYLVRLEQTSAALAGYVGEEPRASVPFGVTPLGECAAGGPAIHREVKNTKQFKYHSHLYLPLESEGKRVGVIWFAAVKPGFFDDKGAVKTATDCSQCLTFPSLEPR